MIPMAFRHSRSLVLILATAFTAGRAFHAPIVTAAPPTARAQGLPNIVIILADDLGYGDVACFNPQSKIKTPHIDRLAREGMIFTDAHSGSAVCTPTRYGLLTGRYAWRSRLKQGVLGGYSPHLIETGRLTVAELLRRKGYATACFGKWHLGWDWQPEDSSFGDTIEPKGDVTKVDYKRPFKNGPTSVGFDEFYGISASLDMPPYVFIHNDRCVDVPTVEKTYIRKGPASPTFEAVNVMGVVTGKFADFVRSHAPTGKPIFAYVALTAPHTPIVPEERFVGRSKINAYADFVIQVDSAVQTILDSLARHGLERDTLVIFTSDNGCSPSADLPALVHAGHDPSAGFRGSKADIFEGGHRVPFVARWPGKIRAGSRSSDTICLVDLMATSAAIIGERVPDAAAEDSVSLLPDMLETSNAPLHEAVIHHSINGSFAIRQGPWKLICCGDSGGWSDPKPGSGDPKLRPTRQLYRLDRDLAERHDLSAEHPEIVQKLETLLERIKDKGGLPSPSRSANGSDGLK